MSKLIFKPEDFYVWAKDMEMGMDPLSGPERLSRVANNIFDKWLESQPIVYGRLENGNFFVPDPKLGVRSGTLAPDTHSARLVCIEEIKPKECQHIPKEIELSYTVDGFFPSSIKSFSRNTSASSVFIPECSKCGIKLILKGEAFNE